MEALLKFALKYINVEAVLNILEDYVTKTALPKVREIVQDWVARIALKAFNGDALAVSNHVCAVKAKGE